MRKAKQTDIICYQITNKLSLTNVILTEKLSKSLLNAFKKNYSIFFLKNLKVYYFYLAAHFI